MPQKKEIKYNPVKSIRIPEELLKEIQQSEGGDKFTKWVLGAIHSKLEEEKGLTKDYKKRLVFLIQNLISMGRSLNQLSRASVSGKPVSVNNELLDKVLKEIQSTKAEVVKVSSKL